MFLSSFLQELPTELQITRKRIPTVSKPQHDLAPLQPFGAHLNTLTLARSPAPSCLTHPLLAALGTSGLFLLQCPYSGRLCRDLSSLHTHAFFEKPPLISSLRVALPLTASQSSWHLSPFEMTTALVPSVEVCPPLYGTSL